MHNTDAMTTKAPASVAVIYARVSTDEQGRTGASIDAQVHTLIAEARRRGWKPHVIREVASAKSMNNRPGLAAALRMLAHREACALMAVRLDRISRSVSDFAQLMDLAHRQGWALVMSEMDLDTTTSQGELMAHVQVSVAQYERRLIGDRTKAGMAERARQGVHLGRSRSLPLEVVQHVIVLRQGGHTLRSIADQLNDEKVPTSTGVGLWTTSKVQSVLKSRTAQQLIEGKEVTVPSTS